MKDILEIKENIRNKIVNKEEKMILFYILDKIKEYEERNIEIVTNFYNQAQIDIIKKYIQYFNMYIHGGLEYNERNLVVLCKNENMINAILSKHIKVIKICYDKFKVDKNISHRDILGSILSLGINRNLIGDIYINNDNSYIIIKQEIVDYIIKNVNSIKHTKVKLCMVRLDEINININDGEIDRILVNSLRIDNIISSYLKISRSKCEQLFLEGKIYINWKNEVKRDKLIKIKDTISIRGYGRIVINNNIGITNKGKNILEIIKYR